MNLTELKEKLEFFLPDSFKGLSKKYILDCYFNNNIQEKWLKQKPSIGDIIVGETGNVFVISNIEVYNENIGGKMYYFGGGLCNRDNRGFLNETFCYSMNESGIPFYNKEKISFNHSKLSDYKFVPYPHEFDRF